MPGVNISRSEAQERSRHIAVDSYDVFLDVSQDADTFIAKSSVTFTCNLPGYDTFIDAVATRIITATLNGQMYLYFGSLPLIYLKLCQSFFAW